MIYSKNNCIFLQKAELFMRWDGSKKGYYKYIKPYIIQKRYWIEPFFGGGNVGFNVMWDFNFSIYILNDINDILYKTYLLLQDKEKTERLLQLIDDTIIFESWYHDILNKYKNKDFKDDIEEVFYFWIIKYYNITSSISRTLNFKRHDKQTLYQDIKDTFKLIKDNQVNITNQDYRQFLKNINSRDILQSCYIYLDPPYNKTKSNGYKGQFNFEEMFELIQPFMDNPILISYNDYKQEWEKYGIYVIERDFQVNNWRKSNTEYLLGNKIVLDRKQKTLF